MDCDPNKADKADEAAEITESAEPDYCDECGQENIEGFGHWCPLDAGAWWL